MCSLHLTVHTHLEQWAANATSPGEQLGVRCLAQGSHLEPEPRFEPTTSGYKSDALSIRAMTAPGMLYAVRQRMALSSWMVMAPGLG